MLDKNPVIMAQPLLSYIPRINQLTEVTNIWEIFTRLERIV